MKYTCAILLCILAICFTKQDFSENLDAVTIQADLLIRGLINESEVELNDLENTYAIERKNKEDILQACYDLSAELTKQLNHIIDIDNDFGSRIEKVKNKLADEAAAIEDNLQSIASKKDESCKNNKQFVQSLKEYRQTLQLLEWIRYTLEIYDGAESVSYLQKLQKLTTSQSFNIQQYIDLLQAGQVVREVRERSEEEIGVGHQFHEKEKLELTGFQEQVIKALLAVKDELYGIIDELEAQTMDRIKSLINSEVEAGLFASDYIFLKEEENRFLATDIERLQGLLNKLEIKKQNSAQKAIDATESLNENDGKCAANKADLEAYIEFYNTKKAQFLDEIATFNEILQMYESQILTSDEIDRIEEWNKEGKLELTLKDNADLNNLMDELDEEYPESIPAIDF